MCLVRLEESETPNKQDYKREETSIYQEPGFEYGQTSESMVRKNRHTNRHVLVFGMRKLDSSIIQREHAMKWFGKYE